LPALALRKILPYSTGSGPLLALGNCSSLCLPGVLKSQGAARRKPRPGPPPTHRPVMMGLAGCAQSSAAPTTNASNGAGAETSLELLLVEVRQKAGCCGAGQLSTCPAMRKV